MPFTFLAFAILGLLAVFGTFWPIRREPFTVVSFIGSFVINEAPLQVLVLQGLATLGWWWLGAFSGGSAAAGWAGLGVAALGWVGLVLLAVEGRRTATVVAAALAAATLRPAPSRGPDGHPLGWDRWWRQVLAFPISGRKIERIRNLDYAGDGIRRHRLDVIRPRRPLTDAPVLFYIHGGAWTIGDKREQGRPMMYDLAARGWVCVAINYRLSPKATWPDHIVDCKRALAWVKAHIADYGGDPGFVAVSGGSAGGHLCALTALSSGTPAWQPGFEDADTSVQAAIPFYGVMDMTGTSAGSGKFGPGLLELLEGKVMKLAAADHPEVFTQASPTDRVHADAPPFFVFQGRTDTLVPVEVARTFVERLRAVSRQPVLAAELPYAQHAFDLMASPRCRATTAGVVAFLESLRATSAAGSADNSALPRAAAVKI